MYETRIGGDAERLVPMSKTPRHKLSFERCGAVRSPTHSVRRLRRRLARQQHAAGSQASPYRFIQSFRHHASHISRVVTVNPRRRLTPRIAWQRMSRATRLVLIFTPWSCSSARTRGMP